MNDRFPRLARLCVIAVLAGVVQSCGSAAAAPSKPVGDSVQHASISVKGDTRTYRLFRPSTLPAGQAVPLLVMLHPCGPDKNGDGQAAFTHFDDVARSGRFIVAYPDGIGGCWNAEERLDLPDDVGFMRALLTRLTRQLPIDRKRVFMAGISGGAAMSYTSACELANQITAIASVAGAMVFIGCRPARPVSVLELHGTLDNWDPGPFNSPGVETVVHDWAMIDGCSGDPVVSQAGITKISTWANCKNGTTVQLDAVAGGHHTWFGSSFDPVPGEPDANTVVWDFFKGLAASK